METDVSTTVTVDPPVCKPHAYRQSRKCTSDLITSHRAAHGTRTYVSAADIVSSSLFTDHTVGGIAEFAGLENDGVEQEETYILHTMKWTQTSVYDT